MRERVTEFNVEKFKPQDFARAAGPPGQENLGEKAANDNLIRQKTCRARAAERPARYSGAFVR